MFQKDFFNIKITIIFANLTNLISLIEIQLWLQYLYIELSSFEIYTLVSISIGR